MILGVKVSPVDLNLLAVYDAIVRTRSVSGAAAEVGITKAAMSHALARLRRELGDPVLVRAGREWRLTERAAGAAARLGEVTRAARGVLARPEPFVPATTSRELRVLATDHVLSLLGVLVGRAVADEAPGVALRFLPILPDDAPALREGGADLAMGVFPGLGPEFRTQALFDDRFACVVRRGHPSVHRKITLEEFVALRHVLIAPRGKPGSVVDDALRERGLSRRVTRYVPFYLLALDFVARTDFAVTMSERLARVHADRFGLQVLRPPLPLEGYTISQVWHPRVDADPAHHWFRRLVARAAAPLRRRAA